MSEEISEVKMCLICQCFEYMDLCVAGDNVVTLWYENLFD